MQTKITWQKTSLKTLVSSIVIIAIFITAAVTHGLWWLTSKNNVSNLVKELNNQIIHEIGSELREIFSDAEAARESLRTIFSQNVLSTEDEAKREFLFLAFLQSQPSLSWASLGWPDGRFFGAQKLGDKLIQMVEVYPSESGALQLRIDRYQIATNDIIFNNRSIFSTHYSSLEQEWYKNVVNTNTPSWSEDNYFPTPTLPNLSHSAPLTVFNKFVGVINLAIEYQRLSKYLGSLNIGKTGQAYLIKSDGTLIAAPRGDSANWENITYPVIQLGANDNDFETDPLLAVAEIALKEQKQPLSTLKTTQQSLVKTKLFSAPFQQYNTYFVTFAPLDFQDWLVLTIIPEEDFLGPIRRNLSYLLIILSGLTLIIAIFITYSSHRWITVPLTKITNQLQHLEHFKVDKITYLPSKLKELDELSAKLVQMGIGLKSFKKYLPADLVRTLVSQGMEAKPGGTEEELTIFFSDLVGFTKLSEQLGQEVVPLLAKYLSEMSNIIHQHKGTVDKFIGDAVMAFWGAPLKNKHHAYHACLAALDTQTALAHLRNNLNMPHATHLHMRIGINTGAVIVGNIGSDERLNYTVIGDRVNVASRLEALNKYYGTDIIIGEDTRQIIQADFITRKLDLVAVYGKEEGLYIYELIAKKDKKTTTDYAWITLYETALNLYQNRKWQKALDTFHHCLQAKGTFDKPCEILIERCLQYQENPPHSSWHALHIIDQK